MISYNSILNAFTKKLNLNFNSIDIFTTEVEQGFENSCFFVELIPMNSYVSTLDTDTKVLTIDIQYISNEDKEYFYKKLSELENIFIRYIRVDDRALKFREVENEIVKDEFGYTLHFMITIEFDEEIVKEIEEYELMKELNLTVNKEEE